MAFLVGFILFFLVITLTLVMGGVSRMGDKRVKREGRATTAQRLPTQRDAHVT